MATSGPFLPKGRKSLYVRISIPRRLQHYFRSRLGDGKDREELWRTLETLDASEAAWKSATVEARIRRVFYILETKGDTMTRDQIEALIEFWLERELDEAEDHRAVCGPVSDQYRDDVIGILGDQREAAAEALISCDYRKFRPEIDDLLRSAGLPTLEPESKVFGRLCREYLRAKDEYLRIEQERWDGNYPPRPNGSHPTPQTSPPAPAKPTGPLLSVAAKQYFNEVPRTKRTQEQATAELEKFFTVIGGDKPIDTITIADGRTYKQSLLDTRKLNLATCLKHLSTLSGIFRWAGKQGYVPDNYNPVRGLLPDKKAVRKQALLVRPFTDAEILQVFSADDFKTQRSENGSRYWVCLLALFMGLRREEAAQAAVTNIHEEEGVHYLQTDVDETLQQNLKTEGSKRKVPIHSSLIALGFLDYVQRTKKAGHARLFPDLKKGGNGYGDAIGKWFSRHVDNIGLTDPKLVFHSLRHGAIHKLQVAKCPAHVERALTGHVEQDVHGAVYGHRELLPMSLLKEGIELLRYDEVVKVLLSNR